MMLKPAGLGSPTQPGPPCPGKVPRGAEQTSLAPSPGQDLPVQHPSLARGSALAGQQLGALAATLCQGHGASPLWPV